VTADRMSGGAVVWKGLLTFPVGYGMEECCALPMKISEVLPGYLQRFLSITTWKGDTLPYCLPYWCLQCQIGSWRPGLLWLTGLCTPLRIFIKPV